LFLCYLGLKTLLAKPAEQAAQSQENSLLGAYASTLVLTLTNPLTILSFAAIFAGLGLAEANSDYLAAVLLVLGVFAGSAAWWLLLSGGVSLFRTKFGLRELGWVNRISGVIITVFGLIALLSLG
jgi:threonine/homoserine/homoserine lactone efflux protein